MFRTFLSSQDFNQLLETIRLSVQKEILEALPKCLGGETASPETNYASLDVNHLISTKYLRI